MEWIKIEDQIPNEGVLVLTYAASLNNYYIDYTVNVGIDTKTDLIFGCNLYDEYVKITHWMPLPKPPM